MKIHWQAANSSSFGPAVLQARSGFTLLEILLALAIMATSFAVLSQLTSVGLRMSTQSQQRIRAATRCEAKLAELLTGVEPLKAAKSVRFRDDPSWLWSVDIGNSSSAGMRLVSVHVTRADTIDGNSASVTLHRLIRPSLLSVDNGSRR